MAKLLGSFNLSEVKVMDINLINKEIAELEKKYDELHDDMEKAISVDCIGGITSEMTNITDSLIYLRNKKKNAV